MSWEGGKDKMRPAGGREAGAPLASQLGRGHESWPPERSRLEALEAAVGGAASFGEDHDRLPGLEEARGAPDRRRVGALGLQREGTQEPDQGAEERDVEEAAPRHEIDGTPHRQRDQRRGGGGAGGRGGGRRGA